MLKKGGVSSAFLRGKLDCRNVPILVDCTLPWEVWASRELYLDGVVGLQDDRVRNRDRPLAFRILNRVGSDAPLEGEGLLVPGRHDLRGIPKLSQLSMALEEVP